MVVRKKKSLKTFVTVQRKLRQSSFQNKKLKVPKLSSPANDMLLNKFTGNYTQGFISLFVNCLQTFFFFFKFWQLWEEKWCVVILWQLPGYLCIRPEIGRGLQRFPSAVDSDFRAIWHAEAKAVQLTLWLSVCHGRRRLTCAFKVMTLNSFPSRRPFWQQG